MVIFSEHFDEQSGEHFEQSEHFEHNLYDDLSVDHK